MVSKFNLDFELFNQFRYMCFIVSENCKILNCNIAAYDTLKVDNIIGKSFLEFINETNKDEAKKYFNECLQKDSSKTFFIKFKTGNDIIDTETYITTLNDHTEKSCFVIAKDITLDRKKDLDRLKFYNVAERAIFPIEITDIKGKITYVNPAYILASGYSKDELIGNNPNVFSSGKHSPKFWQNMWQTIKNGKIWTGEVENKTKDGKPYYAQLTISPIKDDNKNITGFFGVHTDLSERKLLERQLVHTQKMESIGTLVAGIAHEVGNPLASISALVQVLLRTNDDAFAQEKLELIKSQVIRISKIIRNLVDFSRPSNYELKLTDINELLNKAINITKLGNKASDIKFETDFSENINPLPLIADQMEQVFLNILLNAVDAINEKENDNQTKKIFVKSETDENYLKIEFTDNGKGMTDEEANKVFEPFFTTKREGKGTGLGMWISYGIVKSFEGEITVESKLGHGSTFKIILPII